MIAFTRIFLARVLKASPSSSDVEMERPRLKDTVAMPKHTANMHAAQTLRRHTYAEVVAPSAE